MGYYDKGTYSGDDEYEGSQDARERYLDLLSRNRVVNQAMADKMRREEDEKQRKFEAQQHEAEEMAPAERGVRGAQLGMAAGGPWGALVGGVLGKAHGSYDYGKEHGAWAGLKKMLDPTSTARALLSDEGAPAASGAASDIRNTRNENDAKAERMERYNNYMEMTARDRQGAPAGADSPATQTAFKFDEGQTMGDFGDPAAREPAPNYYGQFDDEDEFGYG